MQLLRLELKGFKSFADKTIVHFSPGMTAIVGPNGSGKSNITDAIRWVLGESNIRNLRGQKAEDIIFAGTEKRRALGAAEATIILDNSDRQLAEELTEVAVSRRIYRTGESEFFINKRSCRLKDIHLLLADTGLGRDSMAIIGQNRVDAILNSRPEERRLIFEDVAGISRFKLNKEDALRRIGATERNMERVRDLLASLGEQLEPLAAKAEKTRQHMALSRQKREYDGALAFHRFKTAERILTRLENEHIALASEDTTLQTDLTKLETQRQELQLVLGRRQQELQQCEEEYTESRGEVEKLNGQVLLTEEQERTALREVQELAGRLEELTASQKADIQRIFLLESLIGQEKEVLQSKAVNHGELEKQYESAAAAVEARQAELQHLQTGEERRFQQHVELAGSVEGYRADITSLEERKKEKEELLAVLAKEIDESRSILAKLEQDWKNAGTCYEEARLAAEQMQLRQREAEEHRHQQQTRLEGLRHELQQAEGRLQLLAQWAEQHEGYQEATRSVLQAKQPWRKAMHGAVGDLFQVKDQYVTAIEVALGGSIHHLVAKTSQAAVQAVAYLKEHQSGRATFLPLEAVKGSVLDTPALQEEGVLGRAVDCITFDAAYKNIFAYLLGRTLVVDTMDRAIYLQKKYWQSLRLVTLTGEQFQPGGSLTGGSLRRRKASILAQREEQIQLTGRVKELAAAIADEEAVLAGQTAEQEELRRETEKKEEKVRGLHLLLVQAETRRQAGQERWSRKEQVSSENQNQLSELLRQQEAAEQHLAEAQTLLATLTETAGDGDNRSQLMDELQKLLREQQEAYERVTEARLETEQSRRNLKEKEEQLQERQEGLAAYEERQGPLAAALADSREQAEKVIPARLSKLKEALTELTARVQILQSKREETYTSHRQEQEQAKTISEEQSRLQGRQQNVQRRLLDMEGRLTKNRMETQMALNELSEMGFTKEEGQQLRPEGNVADWQTVQADLLGQLAELGPINPNAVEEYEEAQERHDFLTGQHDDLAEAKENLQRVIAEMDKAMSAQLKDVLTIVAVRFQKIFEQLFGGGTAQIVLTDPSDILASGIDLYIQPPGKKRQQLTLLSGGERALTVIALLFAFLDYRPAPFCVLDEVDAALDEANVERFSRYLHELGGSTQFIVVSHRKKTMEAAEVLQGVTMVERGISRLLTVAFDDVKEEA